MFIQTEATPNPATLKFLPGKPVLPGGTRDYRSADDAAEIAPRSKAVLVPGVSGVFLGQDFITVTQSAAEWQHLKPSILGLIMDHYLSGAPVLVARNPRDADSEEFFAEDDAEIVTTIKQFAGHAGAAGGGPGRRDITFHGFREGVVYLNMKARARAAPPPPRR